MGRIWMWAVYGVFIVRRGKEGGGFLGGKAGRESGKTAGNPDQVVKGVRLF